MSGVAGPTPAERLVATPRDEDHRDAVRQGLHHRAVSGVTDEHLRALEHLRARDRPFHAVGRVEHQVGPFQEGSETLDQRHGARRDISDDRPRRVGAHVVGAVDDRPGRSETGHLAGLHAEERRHEGIHAHAYSGGTDPELAKSLSD